LLQEFALQSTYSSAAAAALLVDWVDDDGERDSAVLVHNFEFE